MEEVKKQFKKMLKKISFFSVIMFITIVIVSSILIVIFQKAKAAAASSSGNYSNYTNLGDYVVKTDEAGAMPALNKEQLKTAIDKCYSGQAHDNLISVLDDFISVQDKYKVNAAFIVAVLQKESSCGTDWDFIDPSTYNWFSIKGTKNGGYVDRDGVSWNVYSSYGEAVEEFAMLMNDSYFPSGKTSVGTIAPTYCNEDWGEKVKEYLDNLYSAAGVAINTTGGTYSGETFTFGEKTYTLFKQRDYNDSFGSGRTIADSGCGATSIAICVSGYMSGETPSTITSKCSKYGYTCDYNSVFPNWLGEYGLKGSFISWNTNAMNSIIQHIKSEKPVILNIGGTMTLNGGASNSYPSGHFLTLLGVDESGNIFVGDPWGADGWTSQQNITNSGTKGYFLVDKK